MSRQVPQYRRHANGQAFVKSVRINGGRPLYLGKYGTEKSSERYREVLKRLSVADQSPNLKSLICRQSDQDRTLCGVVDRYTDFAKKRYSTPGGPTKEYGEMILALNPLLGLFGNLPADEFTPQHLVAVQEHLLNLGTLCRQTINHRVVRIRRMFRWASKFGEVPQLLYWQLKCVDPVPFGRGFEAEPVEPVAWSIVEATLSWLTPVVGAMVFEQAVCGMRPQDVCRMRPVDIDRTGDVWIYRPPRHKSSHRNKTRLIAIPKFAQESLLPFLRRPDEAFLFSPAESYRLLRWQMAKENRNRRTKVYPCEIRVRARRQILAVEATGLASRRSAYDTDSYRRAIRYGIDRAARSGVKIPHWHPNQLRHAISTMISRQFGEQDAQRWLGHERLETTGIYTQRQLGELLDIARKLDATWSGSLGRIAASVGPLPDLMYPRQKCSASSSE